MHQYPFNNNVRAVLHNAVGAADTQIDVVKAVAPYKDAPDTSVSQPLGILSLTDSLSAPTKFEIVHYDNRIDNGTYWSYMGVIRSRDGTSAQTFAAGNPVTQNVTRELLELPPPLYVTTDAGGSVGIGIDTPSERLEVDGSVLVSGGVMFAEHALGAVSGAVDLDWLLYSHRKSLTLAGNTTLTFTPPNQPCSLLVRVLTDGSNPNYTITWPASVKWVGRTVPDHRTGVTHTHLFSFYFDGSVYYGAALLNCG